MSKTNKKEKKNKEKKQSKFLDQIMTGINFMLPCVVSGGILIAIAYLVDDIGLGADTFGYNTAVAKVFYTIGHSVFDLMLPVLAAGIAYAIAGVGAIAAGLAGGVLSAGLTVGDLSFGGSSGFLGALVAGFVAGYIVVLLEKAFVKIPESLEGVKKLLLIPLLSVLVMGLFGMYITEPVVGWLNTAMTNGLLSMQGGSKIILGLIVGGMASIDMGGPFNKTAYLFGVAMLANGQYDIMAAVLAGELVPPYITAFASQIFRKKFTAEQRKTGITNFIVGLAGITEAAIPFWVADTVPVLVSCITGSAIAGGLSMALGCSVMAPYGGLFILPLNSNIPGYLISLVAGIAVGTLLYGILKKKPSETEVVEVEEVVETPEGTVVVDEVAEVTE